MADACISYGTFTRIGVALDVEEGCLGLSVTWEDGASAGALLFEGQVAGPIEVTDDYRLSQASLWLISCEEQLAGELATEGTAAVEGRGEVTVTPVGTGADQWELDVDIELTMDDGARYPLRFSAEAMRGCGTSP